MLIQNQIGPVATTASVAPGTLIPARAGNMGDHIVSELHGRYYETTYRKAMFSANVALQTTTVGTAAAYTGLAVTNPIGSQVNLVMNKVGIAFSVVATAAAYIGLMGGYNGSLAVTQTTPTPVKNKFLGGPTGYAVAASSITAPGVFLNVEVFASIGTVALTATGLVPGFFDVEGSWIVPPGGVVAIFSTVAETSEMNASMSWEEVPI